MSGDLIIPIIGRRVEWFSATFGHEALGEGKVIAYCDAPQVFIETDDGKRFWWRADLARDITCEHCGGTGRSSD
jgi:hypothetical protein